MIVLCSVEFLFQMFRQFIHKYSEDNSIKIEIESKKYFVHMI